MAHTFTYGSFATTSTGKLVQVGAILGIGFCEVVDANGYGERVAVDTLAPSQATSF